MPERICGDSSSIISGRSLVFGGDRLLAKNCRNGFKIGVELEILWSWREQEFVAGNLKMIFKKIDTNFLQI